MSNGGNATECDESLVGKNDLDTTSVPPEEGKQPQIASTGSSSEKPLEEQDKAQSRELHFGDLVRVSDEGANSNRLLTNRRGQLGRVTQCNNDSTFDIDWVMGGRATKIERECLVHTTATEEGMTDDSLGRKRQRRVRKQPDMIDPTPALMRKVVKKPATKKPKKTVTAVKKATKAKKSAPKAKTPSKAKAKKKPKGSDEATKKSTPKSKTASKKPKAVSIKAGAGKTSTSKASSSNQATQLKPATLEIYDRHKREFERIVARLEKVDQFGWFHDGAPDEFTENYASSNVSANAGVGGAPQAEQPDGGSNSKVSGAVDKVTAFPTHPPYNWEMVRRRMSRGRYVQDRVSEEYNTRFAVMREYYESTSKRGAKKRKNGKLESRRRVLNPLGVNWDTFKDDIVGMCTMAMEREDESDAQCRGSLTSSAKKVMESVLQAYEKTGKKQMQEINSADLRHKFGKAIEKSPNKEAAMQSWRKNEFPERRYERLAADTVCAGLSAVDEHIANYELLTNLANSFVGISYRYDDTGQSEAWMKSIVDETGSNSQKSKSSSRERQAALALAADDGVTRAQVNATMQTLLIGVQDKVMTDTEVLNQPELRSANWSSSDSPRHVPGTAPEIVEQPVWGIDCYTRRNISICLQTEFDADTALQFIEKWLLPAINACPSGLACNLANAARVLEGLKPQNIEKQEPITGNDTDDTTCSDVETLTLLGEALQKKIKACAPPWLKGAAHTLRIAYETLGQNFFRVHPKGHGSVLLSQRVPANSLVTFYRGEVYPSWRWGEKMDAIEITQERKALKPALPDFYNMALERPQVDPRGYGLLFVDASRKAGHGSSLSHSCAPTCEVRVAAVDGELTLAMTTLRELEIGEELTFDYNAVTESLNEYSSAVCLCGYGKCRGSFLHFATADCYQSVLNRNAPIATRFSNLVKGSMKQVMSEEDTKVLKSHGFRTAAFGAISVNRRISSDEKRNAVLDNMDVVPVWLRTYVADTLRYIEYERRALPIALICDHLSTSHNTGKVNAGAKVKDATELSATSVGKEPKEEPAFFFFVRSENVKIKEMLVKEGIPASINGVQLNHAVKKVGSGYWKMLSDAKKAEWKKKANDDFQKRHKEWRAAQKKSDGKFSAKSEKKNVKNMDMNDLLKKSDISFQDADAEGVSAMEQRIQQLTQALSRVGRVLDRHREWKISSEGSAKWSDSDASCLRNAAHAPIAVAPDSRVIDWVWNNPGGVVASLLKNVDQASFTRSELLSSLKKVQSKYGCLSACGASNNESGPAVLDVSQGRRQLSEALLEFRKTILEELKEMGKIYGRYRKAVMKAQKKSQKQEQESKTAEPDDVDTKDDACGAAELKPESSIEESTDVSPRSVVAELLESMVSEVERRLVEPSLSSPAAETTGQPRLPSKKKAENNITAQDILEENPWIGSYSSRFVLQTTADLLLMYANTKAFFVVNQYRDLMSTPIEVYARELGNEVPKSAIDTSIATEKPVSVDTKMQKGNEPKPDIEKQAPLCLPDDIVAEVTVSYRGDFILAQLLQWYNGGIGQKPGLPDMSGCAQLPSINSCFKCELLAKTKEKVERKTHYESKLRSKLIEWLQDPYQRGSPWPTDLKIAFEHSSAVSSASGLFGSPVVDFLVTGDESSIFETLAVLDAENTVTSKSTNDAFLSSVDKGRPAQAVSTWVQCENSDCLKWRKIPWHVDIDLLPENFFCKDNIWNPNGNSCDKPEDDWDNADAMVGADGKVEGSPVRKRKNTELSPKEESSFTIGARFDIERNGKYVCGTVLKVDFSGKVKRILFRFAKTSSKYDEWIEFGSPRVFTWHTKVDPAVKKQKYSDGKPPKPKAEKAASKSSKDAVVPAPQPKQIPELQPKSKQDGAIGAPITDVTNATGVAATGKVAENRQNADANGNEAVAYAEFGIPARPKVPCTVSSSQVDVTQQTNFATITSASDLIQPPLSRSDDATAANGKRMIGTESVETYGQSAPPVHFGSGLTGPFNHQPTMPQGTQINGAQMLAAQIEWLASNGYPIPPEWRQAYTLLQQMSWQTREWGTNNS